MEARRQAPRQIEAELPRVVELAPDSPEPRREELAADGLRRLAPDGPLRVGLELVLLLVRPAEQDEARPVQRDEQGELPRRQRVRIVDEVPPGDAVEEGHEHVVPPDQHPAEALREDVPREDHPVLELEVVHEVREVERLVDPHPRRHVAELLVLRGRERDVEQAEAHQRGAVREELEIDAGDLGVEVDAVEAVEDEAERALPALLLARDRQVEREREGGGVRDDEEREERGMDGGEGGGAEEDERRRGGDDDQEEAEAVERVRLPRPVAEERALGLRSGDEERSHEEHADEAEEDRGGEEQAAGIEGERVGLMGRLGGGYHGSPREMAGIWPTRVSGRQPFRNAASSLRPAAWLFSGWNCVARTFSRCTAAVTRWGPCWVTAATIAGSSGTAW